MNSSPQPFTYTIAETAAALRVSKRTVGRLIATGKLRVIRMSCHLVRVPAEALQQLIGQTDDAVDAEPREAHHAGENRT